MQRIGILGGGQLGRMIAIAVHELGFIPFVFTNSQNNPALAVVRNSLVADYHDEAALYQFIKNVDVITFEFENIPVKCLEILAAANRSPTNINNNIIIAPSVRALRIAQNRILEKTFLKDNGIKTARFKALNSQEELLALQSSDFPLILKTAEFGYDGKGQILLENLEAMGKAENFSFPAVAESVVNFQKELSVIVARNKTINIGCHVGSTERINMVNFPVAENIHKNGILVSSKVPADISKEIEQKAINIAFAIAEKLDISGLLATELFLSEDEELLVNEIAPRPHNSGHWSLDATDISQFHMLVLSITGHNLKVPSLLHKCTMKNLLGLEIEDWPNYAFKEKHKVYVYGKGEAKPLRKMGHVNILE